MGTPALISTEDALRPSWVTALLSHKVAAVWLLLTWGITWGGIWVQMPPRLHKGTGRPKGTQQGCALSGNHCFISRLVSMKTLLSKQ